jgi:hypothetical protein
MLGVLSRTFSGDVLGRVFALISVVEPLFRVTCVVTREASLLLDKLFLGA